MNENKMFFYSYFSGHVRDILAFMLHSKDPFNLLPCEILERVLATGYGPFVQEPKTEHWRILGTVSEVKREGQTFLVAVCQEQQTISIQEVRGAAYDVASAHITPLFQRDWV